MFTSAITLDPTITITMRHVASLAQFLNIHSYLKRSESKWAH
jgi:hypothetical protein